MSYTRTAHTSVYVSGSVSYPASEYGGTVSYSETVPITINVHVDTDPFDESVELTSDAVDVLTGAVTSMKSTQVKAIKANAKKISDHLLKGFFATISHDLTSQRTEANSVLKSKFALLAEYAKEMHAIRDRMEADTRRIYEHYYTIFHHMDEDMEKRIRELDQDSFDLKEKIHDSLISENSNEGVVSCVEGNQSGGNMSRMIASARLGKSISGILSSISQYVSHSISFEKNIEEMVRQEKVSRPIPEYIPSIVYSYKTMNGAGGEAFSCRSPEFKGKDVMMNGIGRYISAVGPNAWRRIPPMDANMIDQFFMNYLDEASRKPGMDTEEKQRVLQKTLQLWRANKDYMAGL